MRNFLRRWLGIEILSRMSKLNANGMYGINERVQALESDFNSRDTCKVCGKHRYNSPKCLVNGGNKHA